MARITPKTEALHASLKAQDIDLLVGQIQSAYNEGLGPLPDDPDPTGHWRAVEAIANRPLPGASESGRAIRRRLPDYDLVAMDLAVAGHPCARLTKAVQRLRSAGEADAVDCNDPEAMAELTMQQAHSAGGRERSGGTMISQFLQGSISSGSPGPARSKDDEELEHLGRVQATVTDLFEVEAGGSASETLDPEDLAAELSGAVDVSTVSAGFQMLDALGVLSPGAADRLVDEAPLDALTNAVQSASALLPQWEALGMPSATESQRWESVASAVPLVLSLMNRLMELGSTVDLRSLFNRPDITARYRQATEAPEASPLNRDDHDRNDELT